MVAISQMTLSFPFFFNENIWILIKISLKFIPKGPINNVPALFEIMAWHQPGDKPLSQPMMASLLMHIYASYGLNGLAGFVGLRDYSSPIYFKGTILAMNQLTHCGLVMAYVNIELGQHQLR